MRDSVRSDTFQSRPKCVRESAFTPYFPDTFASWLTRYLQLDTEIFAEKGSYASGEYIGEDLGQHLKMGFLPGAFSLMEESAFEATAHAAVHDAAHCAFMTLPHHTSTREGGGQPVVNRSFPLAFFARSVT